MKYFFNLNWDNLTDTFLYTRICFAIYSLKSILILRVERMINTRIIRWILADILTIMNQYVSRKFHNSKRYAFLFFLFWNES